MELKEFVQEKYGEAARRVTLGEGLPADCCASTSCCSGLAAASCDPITSKLYDREQEGQIPEAALRASLGCGNPTALARLMPVNDLRSQSHLQKPTFQGDKVRRMSESIENLWP